jgi:hypothetical protein
VSKVRCAQALPSGQILLPLLLEEAFLDFLEYAMLPSLTGPIPGRELVFCGVTRVTSSKVLTTPGLVLFYRHVLVAETDKLYFRAFFSQNGTLFRRVWSPFRLVKTRKSLPAVFYSARRCSSYVFCRSHNSPLSCKKPLQTYTL